MSHQVAVTIRAAINPGQTEPLKRVLAAMAPDSGHNALIPFAEVAATHFARLVIIDEGTPEASLLLTMDCDAPAEQRLRDLVTAARDGLDEVFRYCAGYPPEGERTAERRLRYLRSRMTGVDVFYVHAVGRTLRQIRQEEELRLAIEGFLDRFAGELSGQSALAVREKVRSFVWNEPRLAWSRRPAAPPGLWFRLREAIHKYGVPILLLSIIGILIPALVIWVIWLRIHEFLDPPPKVPLDAALLRRISESEDFIEQNAITTLAPIKPGLFWRLTATLFYGVGNYASRHVFNQGSLSGLTTVHFARFMKIDGGSKVLFTSYYDGSLESYMDDFITQIAWVLNAMFGTQSGYPRTRWLFLAGAANEVGFKTFLRGHQLLTQVWYSAYDNLAAVNLDNNAQIRAGLYGDMTPAQAEEWLRRL